jgi:HK97 family phage prohead protease
MADSLVIEGYASLFGAEDLAGDVVRAGAFTRSLARGRTVPMLLQHAGGSAGRWNVMREDGRGLFVRGLVTDESVRGIAALKLIRDKVLGGLSIGFIARDWSPRSVRGRELRVLELPQVQQHVAGLDQRRPGVTGAHHPHAMSGGRRIADDAAYLVQTPGAVQGRRPELHRPPPVANARHSGAPASL